MRMHRGSSKESGGPTPVAGNLPLSASPVRKVRVVLELTRAGSVERHEVDVEAGSIVRLALRAIGQAAEGSLVLEDEVPVPLDTPIERPARFTVVSTFSGG
jgi:sulfur carrier protein ThiS